jgi:hypothetical protein
VITYSLGIISSPKSISSEYFEISPQEFFDYDNKNPKHTEKLTAEIQKLNPKQQECILALVSDLAQKNPTN